ncbi:hypothetical protein J437_LFUL018441, partial [Ladona fulva]
MEPVIQKQDTVMCQHTSPEERILIINNSKAVLLFQQYCAIVPSEFVQLPLSADVLLRYHPGEMEGSQCPLHVLLAIVEGTITRVIEETTQLMQDTLMETCLYPTQKSGRILPVDIQNFGISPLFNVNVTISGPSTSTSILNIVQRSSPKLDTVSFTGLKLSKVEPKSSGDQLLLFSEALLLSSDPLLVKEPTSLVFLRSKLPLLDLRSLNKKPTCLSSVLLASFNWSTVSGGIRSSRDGMRASLIELRRSKLAQLPLGVSTELIHCSDR